MMPTHADTKDRKSKPPDLNIEGEAQELSKLLTLINTSHVRQKLPSLDSEDRPVSNALQWPSAQPQAGQEQHRSTEADALEKFSLTYQTERNFTDHPQNKYFSHIFSSLVKQRLSNLEWMEQAPPENILRMLVCFRIMMRDNTYQMKFFELGGVKVLSQHMQKATDSYMVYGDGPYVVDILKEMTNIFQKLSAVVKQHEWMVDCGAHTSLVLLMSANDVIVLHCTLHALISLAQSPEPSKLIAELNSIEVLLRILQDYDTLSKKLAATLLRLLFANSQAREMFKIYDGIPLLLSLLHSDSLKLLWNVLWCLVQLSSDQEMSNDIRLMGGIPLLLSLLHERKFVSDRSATSAIAPASASIKSPAVTEEDMWFTMGGLPLTPSGSPSKPGKQTDEMKEQQLSMKSACCACLTELVLNDTNAQHVVLSNGVYSIGLLMLPQVDASRNKRATLQANAFRTLRFLFSMERNRGLFKRLFPPELFEEFIDIGHYNRDIKAYYSLVEKINSLSEETLDEIHNNLEQTNQNKAPSRYIQDYAVLELLGSGAFGSVYKVKKKTAGQSGNFLAMKEINTNSWGPNSREREKSVGSVISELTIIREQLKHPNVVRYYKTFVEMDKLYIVMELIEGAPLYEHFNSLKEKKEHLSEERIWNIFTQIILALRYLHKDKGIVHRDLSPNNIMLGENDKVTITDFGLAKQKQADCSKMNSVVGTILYSCPEVVQSQPYGEKADVWATGCILYQMCTLTPPFYGTNMLSLVTKIVSSSYASLPEGMYSDQVVSTIEKCLTVDPTVRPDTVGVAAHIADKIMVQMDKGRREQMYLEKKLEQERRRTQRHFFEANKNMQNYHKLFLMSQERYDKLVNLASSGGGSSIKDENDLTDGVFSDIEMNAAKSRNGSNNTQTSSNGKESADERTLVDGGDCWPSDDELASSSGSEPQSRESSAGATRSVLQDSVVPRPPEGSPKSRRKIRNCDQFSQQLTLDIPHKSSVSRDSGISSGDPSPNNCSPPFASKQGTPSASQQGPPSASQQGPPSAPVSCDTLEPLALRPRAFTNSHRSPSCPTLESNGKRMTSSGRIRPNSATPATLTISPRKVQKINDPILQILHQLHKIIYITQLPPTLALNMRRRVVEQFKRALFAPQSTCSNLKSELKKLITGSRDVIDLHLSAGESQKLARQVSQEQEAIAGNSNNQSQFNFSDESDGGITYEHIQTIIESVLVESGYYDMGNRTHNRTSPLGPLMASAFNSDAFGVNQSLKSA